MVVLRHHKNAYVEGETYEGVGGKIKYRYRHENRMYYTVLKTGERKNIEQSSFYKRKYKIVKA